MVAQAGGPVVAGALAMGDVRELVTGTVAIVGALVMMLSGLGVLRLRDLYARMHAAAKASTLGALLVGFAGVTGLDDGRSKLVLALVFLFITGPSSAHLVARSAYRAEGVDIDVERHDDLAAAFEAIDHEDDGTAFDHTAIDRTAPGRTAPDPTRGTEAGGAEAPPA
jgi:multicomponent Na+:H+ antiporter subunit G